MANDDGSRRDEPPAWADVLARLQRADATRGLSALELEQRATAAYMLGRRDEHADCLERAHDAHVAAGHPSAAFRCAFWIGLNQLLQGKAGHATGWFRRAESILPTDEPESSERGYLLIPAILRSLSAGEYHHAHDAAAEAARLAREHDDDDLFALAAHEQGHALLELGQLEDGLALMDEAMLAVASGQLSPVATGLVYCSVIGYCQDFFALERSREWTEALSAWCDKQPDLVNFTGVCLVHRAEIMQLAGDWPQAVDEARRAQRRFKEIRDQAAAGRASYREGEVQRLRGDFEAAERAYRRASALGWQPQPGLALLRLAQGDLDSADAAIRRVWQELPAGIRRAQVLSAVVEIMLARGALDDAEAACDELELIADEHGSAMLRAMAAQARGAALVAKGEALAGLNALRVAADIWRELGVPYEEARSRQLAGTACRLAGDDDAANLELIAARQSFANLGARPDAARLEEIDSIPSGRPSSLSPRELEVLGHVAQGKTNRSIAEDLVVSERTIERHVSNILRKLGVSTRAGATAFAYEHDLV